MRLAQDRKKWRPKGGLSNEFKMVDDDGQLLSPFSQMSEIPWHFYCILERVPKKTRKGKKKNRLKTIL